ncbi:MAG: biotin--[acetyl-CoA-carboxylase] ligase [Acidobacteria bacterium]|nr:biotin--[acetyl-CoA-carboxylase] ligase [Acidobacteriota bacterium]
MSADLSLLDPSCLRPLISNTIFFAQITHYTSLPSTNTVAMQAAAEGAPEGSLYIAEQQTAGRGRGGHTWESPASEGIYCSAVLRPRVGASELLSLTLVGGLAVRDGIRSAAHAQCDLRWPNDVLLNQRKVCGVLAEAAPDAGGGHYVVLGIGVNVNQGGFPGALSGEATSLYRETGSVWPRAELLAEILLSLDRRYLAFRAGAGAADICREFETASSYARGRHVRVDEQGGYEGVTEGLDPQGFLLVRTSAGLRRVLSGGVRAIAPRP